MVVRSTRAHRRVAPRHTSRAARALGTPAIAMRQSSSPVTAAHSDGERFYQHCGQARRVSSPPSWHPFLAPSRRHPRKGAHAASGSVSEAAFFVRGAGGAGEAERDGASRSSRRCQYRDSCAAELPSVCALCHLSDLPSIRVLRRHAVLPHRVAVPRFTYRSSALALRRPRVPPTARPPNLSQW